MSPVDWIIVSVALLSVALGLLRGVARELLSLAGWVVGIVLALQYSEAFGATLPLEPVGYGVRTVLAGALIVLAALIVAGLLGALLRMLLAAVRLSTTDRILGAAFGALRAALVIGAVVLIARYTEAPSHGWWQESRLLPWVEAGVAFATPWLPRELMQAPSQWT